MAETWLVTGGAGFIGSNFVRMALGHGWCGRVVVIDALTYAGNPDNLMPYIHDDKRLHFVRGDISDGEAVEKVFEDFKPRLVFHFAAESHVDRSIDDPAPFIRTNVLGTQVLLDAARRHETERFVHVSTDEVFGALALDSREKFNEETPYDPRSPYAASKAGADFLVRAAYHTHGQDVVITNCSNNYGPYQYPEKFIPLIITNALENETLPVYGDGLYVRDWIHVVDHCQAVYTCAMHGRAGETYCIGADNEQANVDVVKLILELTGKDESLIRKVKDRPGHDRRYAIDSSKIHEELGWKPSIPWEEGLRETVEWYTSSHVWVSRIKSGEFRKFYKKQYDE